MFLFYIDFITQFHVLDASSVYDSRKMETPAPTTANGEEPPRTDKLKPYKKIFKVIVIGDSNVGKTSLTYRFCEGGFLEHSEATIGVDFRSRNLEID